MNGDIFKVQPKQCRASLPYKDLSNKSELIRRVLLFDPAEFYNRVGNELNPYQRHNGINLAYPKLDRVCACGCGRNPREHKVQRGVYLKWYNKDCAQFWYVVAAIIKGEGETIRNYLGHYYGEACMECGDIPKYNSSEQALNGLYADHIVAVMNGGGGSWLSNYQWLCDLCHTEKTREDFNWKRN